MANNGYTSRHAQPDQSARDDLDGTPVSAFTQVAIPELSMHGVQVRQLRHAMTAAELHVTLVLPSHDRHVRRQALAIVDAFEESVGFRVSVSMAAVYADDPALT